MKTDNIWMVIPCYDVAPHLEQLLDQVAEQFPLDRVIVVDDGSTDETSSIAEKTGAHLIKHNSNQGKGAALQTGFEYARKQNAEWILTLDGDLQHDPKYIQKFLELAEAGNYDLIIGVRRRDSGNMPWDRRFSNWSTSLLLTIIAGQKILDSQCGFRLFKANHIDGMEMKCKSYDFETEFLLKMTRRGARIGWVTIPTKYDSAHSSIRRLTDTIKFLKVVTRHIFSVRSE